MAYEQPHYDVVQKDGDFELRRYAPFLAAQTVVEGDFEKVGGRAFRVLAGYISGNNEDEEKISMTAPVTQRPEGGPDASDRPMLGSSSGEGRYVFSFVVPAEYSAATAPAPADPAVQLRQLPGRLMAVLRYSGGWSEDRYREHETRLLEILEDRSLRPVGQPIFARYNSPFTLWFLRHNEVMIQVADSSDSAAPSDRGAAHANSKLVDFSDQSAGAWRPINDGVMGGLSGSTLRLTTDGTAIFEGDVSLENNGGFASVRHALGRRDLSAWTGVELRVRGDGRRYRARLHTHGGMDGVAYQAGFASGPGVWETVRLPFEDFEPTYRGRRPDGAPPLDTATIEQIGLMIADRQAGPFRLEIGWIRAYGATEVFTNTED